MNIVIFGASGSLGKIILQQAIDQGLLVTAFTRKAENLASFKAYNLQVVEGDVLSKADVAKVIQGKDAVICALGDGAKGQVRAVGTAHIIQGMNQHGCKRLICQTTLGMGETWNNLNFFWKRIMFGWLLKKAWEDHRMQEDYVFDSHLDYTIVRPSAFAKGPAGRQFRVNFSPSEKNLKLKIPRADVAEFMLKQLHSREFIRKAVSISY